MKIFTKIDKVYLYSLIIFTLLSTSLFSLSNEVVFSAPGDPPTITINSPSANAFLNTAKVVISGTFTDDNVQETNLIFTAYDKGTEISNSDTNSIEWNIDESGAEKTWSFSKTLSDGDHDISVEIKERPPAADTMKDTASVTFSVDTSRPKISSILVNYVDINYSKKLDDPNRRVVNPIDLLSSGDMVNVTTNTSITVSITDNMITKDTINNPIYVFNSVDGNIQGITTVTEKTNPDRIEVVFTPTANLMPSSTYYILINPAFIDKISGEPSLLTFPTDAVGNSLFPIIRKFSTERASNTTNMSEDQKVRYSLNDPHGKFQTNTNSCKTCHNNHDSERPGLEQPSFNNSTYYYYCMSCHDGTGAAKPENMHENSHFQGFTETPSEQKSVEDCTTCHDPHSAVENGNPNILREKHYVYTHVDETKIDSLEQSCASCHPDDTQDRIDDAITRTDGSVQKVLHYRKSTANGEPDDYALCLRCHDGSKENVKNIKTFYQDTNSKHRFAAADGSSLNTISSDNGHIPCAECHNSHGSSNIMILKEKLGHEDRRKVGDNVFDLDSDKAMDANEMDTNSDGIWDPDKERVFCEKCHNGSTSIYGVTGKALSEANHPETETEPLPACSSCHGGASSTFMEAVHAPK